MKLTLSFEVVKKASLNELCKLINALPVSTKVREGNLLKPLRKTGTTGMKNARFQGVKK